MENSENKYVIMYDNHDSGQFEYLDYLGWNDSLEYSFCREKTDAIHFTEQEAEALNELFKKLRSYLRMFVIKMVD